MEYGGTVALYVLLALGIFVVGCVLPIVCHQQIQVTWNTLTNKWKALTVLVCLGILVGCILGMALLTEDLGRTSSDNSLTISPGTAPASNPTAAPTIKNFLSSSPSAVGSLDSSPTLSAILKRETLVCGITPQPGYAEKNNQGQWEGFDVDLCRAMAVAIFGNDRFLTGRDSEPVEFVEVDAVDRFMFLSNQTIDVLLGITSQTLERTINEATTSKGYTFSTPYLIDGLTYGAADLDYLSCVQDTNATNVFNEICTQATICVRAGTTHQAEIQSLLPNFEGSYVTATNRDVFYESFNSGLCTILAGEQFDLAPSVLVSRGYTGPYEVLPDVFTKELISIVTRDGDPKWSNFVNHCLQALMTAEEIQMTEGEVVASALKDTSVFGDRYATMFRDAVGLVGPLNNLYEKYLASLVNRTSANQINVGYTAAMFAKPFGDLETKVPGELKSSTIAAIKTRGYIIVGITEAPLFAAKKENGDYEGIDADCAKALAAAIFDGNVSNSTIRFVTATAQDRFQMLLNGDVDVLARVTTITMERQVKETTTGKGYTFATPNFHDSVRFVGPAECAENEDYSSEGCLNFKVCVESDTTQYNLLAAGLVPEDHLVVVDGDKEVVKSFVNGTCQVFASGVVGRTAAILANYSGEYVTGTVPFSRESLALVTNEDDFVFSKLIDAVMTAILYADEQNITQANAGDMPAVNQFCPLICNDGMFRNVIRAVGNYQDIWDRYTNPQGGLVRGQRNERVTYPFDAMLLNVQTWDRRPPAR